MAAPRAGGRQQDVEEYPLGQLPGPRDLLRQGAHVADPGRSRRAEPAPFGGQSAGEFERRHGAGQHVGGSCPQQLDGVDGPGVSTTTEERALSTCTRCARSSVAAPSGTSSRLSASGSRSSDR
ncbi:hypothetical protein [Streptomyces phaeochromogenes]|uniref:hypothetical protein n=1 Tax=Streptomyces phaeochromogenes TaxID=1923 RepID=UPI0027D823B6|nr:hypothetical protein [Streptomyces phaeochromogenes]